MADVDLSIAAPAVETPSEPAAVEPVETPEPQELPEDVLGTDSEDPEAPAEGELADDDTEEFEWNGKKVRGPKGLKDGLLMQADYTKKTQTVAEKAKALEAREAEITQQAEATEADLDARAELRSINARLAEYAKLTPADWQHHLQTDPMAVQQARLEIDALKDQKAELEGKVSKAAAERTEKAQQDLAKRVQETITFAQKEILGWKPELTDTLVKFALDEGIPEQVLQSNWGPTLYKLLHRAHIGHLALTKQPTAAAKPAPAPVAPLTKVTAGNSTPVSKSLTALADADMEAYVAARNAGRKR